MLLAGDPVDIGTRRELFVDEALIEKFAGNAALKLHQPTAREVTFQFDRPWEGNACGYVTLFRDGDIYRMYYRGHRYVIDDPPLKQAQSEVVCYAESRDGIHWTRPNLGLFAWNGSKENNIIWMGTPEAHNFAPFKDANPACPPEQKYKAIGGTVTSRGLNTFQSADGIHWTRWSTEPVVTQGAFDSHNTAFWDAAGERYVMYVRSFENGLRAIGMSESLDYVHWSAPVSLEYPNSPPQQMYTNQIAPYERAPHVWLGFPTRYVARPLGPHVKNLEPVELRKLLIAADERVGTDLTDGVFMSTRDGKTFRRWDEAFLRPGPENEGRWIYGDNYQCYGLLETLDGAANPAPELSLYFTEGAWRDDAHRLRRYTLRLDGFVSAHAPYAGGELVTKPLRFAGDRLHLNYATSAAGSVRVEIQDESGTPLPGFALDDAEELFGDSIEQPVLWKGGSDVSSAAGKAVRLRFVFKDADLYSFHFVDRRNDAP